MNHERAHKVSELQVFQRNLVQQLPVFFILCQIRIAAMHASTSSVKLFLVLFPLFDFPILIRSSNNNS